MVFLCLLNEKYNFNCVIIVCVDFIRLFFKDILVSCIKFVNFYKEIDLCLLFKLNG